jgi:GNAT superfamily N-acetyltransferase
MTVTGTRDSLTGGDLEERRLRMLAWSAAQGFHLLSSAAGGGHSYVEGVYCWHSTSFVPAFNGASLVSYDFTSPHALAALARHFVPRGRPYALVTLDTARDTRVSEAVHAAGYYEFDSSPAMWLDGPATRWAPPPSGLEMRRITTPRDLASFRAIVSTVFHISSYEVDLVMNDGILRVPEVAHYLGLVHGVPVASASMVLVEPLPGVWGGVSSVWNVATLHGYRRRGIAAEMMHRLIEDARRDGFDSSMLLASRDGLPMYERLGYATLGDVRLFAPPR